MLSNFLDWVSGLIGNGGGNAAMDSVGGALGALVQDAGTILTTVLPFGIALMAVGFVPRLIKRIIGAFM